MSQSLRGREEARVIAERFSLNGSWELSGFVRTNRQWGKDLRLFRETIESIPSFGCNMIPHHGTGLRAVFSPPCGFAASKPRSRGDRPG